MTSRVKVTDRGWSAMLKRVQDARAASRVFVGVLDDEPKRDHAGGDSPLTLVEVAAIHEFGTATIPQRSFVRSTVDAHVADIRRLQGVLARKVVADRITARQGLGQLGAKVAAMMQRTITAGIDPPLKQATIDRKGSTKPLVDTSQLKASLTWKVAT